jgi:hypothetical protein
MLGTVLLIILILLLIGAASKMGVQHRLGVLPKRWDRGRAFDHIILLLIGYI